MPTWAARLAVVTILVGVGGGVAGIIVSLALHLIEHVAYGYAGGSFLSGVMTSPGWRRVTALALAGVIGAIGWWALRRWGRAVVSVEQAAGGHPMPALVTAVHAALQIVIVGLGASIGRELAPRELGALMAQWISTRAGVTARERRILVACGAGAGLAAVYNVPLGGAIFSVEILLAEISLATIIPALLASGIATLLAWVVISPAPVFTLPRLTASPSLIVWSLIIGPIIGICAWGFTAGARFATNWRPHNWMIMVTMPVIFTLVGVTSIWFPEILGNGRALGQVAFTVGLTTAGGFLLAVLKSAATLGTIGSGASGGTLTPSLAIGASLGAGFGGLWMLAWPGTEIAAFALVAAAAFLSSTMRAPLTAIVLVIEFSNQGLALAVPILLSVAGASAISYLLDRRRLAGVD